MISANAEVLGVSALTGNWNVLCIIYIQMRYIVYLIFIISYFYSYAVN